MRFIDLAASGRDRDALATGRVIAGDRLLVFLRAAAAGVNDLAAVFTARTDVDDPVGALVVSSSCSTTIRTMPRSRRRSRAQKPAVVTLMQADGRLVQNVEDAYWPEPICVARRIR